MNEQNITIRDVTFEEVVTNFHLVEAHWQEVALNKDVMVLKPDAEKYRMLAESGRLIGIGAFVGEELVGYSASILTNHLHYADLCLVANDLLFVHPDYRKGRLGLRLISETEKRAKAAGALMVTWHAKENTALQALMPRIGYGIQDIIFSKVI